MTEKEKMLTEKLHFAGDEELGRDREYAKNLCFDYNNLRPFATEERTDIIKKLFGKTKDRFCLLSPVYCDYGYNIEIGDNFFSNYNVTFLDCAKIIFGDNVLVGPNCGFYRYRRFEG
jgi:acetyltransferase-like isoleucine patch superfamily enzyme